MDKLYDFANLVVETKQFGNLISAKDSEKFLSRHIADSLMPYIYIRRETRDERRENVPESLSSLLFEPRLVGSDMDVQSPTQHSPLSSLLFEPRLVGSDMDVQAPPQHSPLSSFVCSEPASVLSSIKWADMGAGAGCPVFPLAIAMPEVQFYAVEPRHMRVEFMNYAKEKLGLKNLTVVGKRFETSGLTDLDFISCRALSTFENDWERAQPALKKGGLFITLKSFNSISHLENDPAVNIWKYKLPNEEQDYALVTRGNK